MTTYLIRINAVLLLLFLEVVSVNIIGSFTTHKGPEIETTADNIVGEWMDKEKARTIKITKNGVAYEGTLTATPTPKLIGTKVLTGLVYNDNKYTGKVYVPSLDAIYDCTAKLKDNNSLIIEGTVGFISKETVWTRKK